MSRSIRESRAGQWLLNLSMRQHTTHPCRYHLGPARCTFAGWLYFRVLCGLPRADERNGTFEYGV